MLDKITENDLISKGVIGLPDTPGLSTIDMQKKFEELVTDVIVPIFNNNMDKLNAGGADDPAPRLHDSEDNRYGAGTGSMYGHVKLSDDTDISEGAAADSVGASHKALVDVNAVVKGHTTSIASIGAKANNNETRIREAEGRLTTAETNITNQGTRLSTAEESIITNAQNIATNAAAISQTSSHIAEISEEIKVEKSIVVDDYALVDSGSGVLNDLVVYGRSKQNKTTGKNLSSVQYGVTWNAEGTGFTSDVKRVSFDVPIDCNVQKKYAFSWVNNSNTRVSLYARFKDTSGAMHTDLLFASNAINEGRAITVSSDYVMAYFFLVAETSESSIEIIKKVVNLQIEKGDSVTPYEPYTGGIPSPNPQYPSAIRALSGIKTENEDKSESTESALPTLYGIPVASGGNYVDKSGQHWISDTLDLEKGTITRRVDQSKLDETQSIENKSEWALSTPVTEPIPQATLNTLRQLRSFADKTHIYCDNGSLEAVIAENTEMGNAIGRVEQKVANLTKEYIVGDVVYRKYEFTDIVVPSYTRISFDDMAIEADEGYEVVTTNIIVAKNSAQNAIVTITRINPGKEYTGFIVAIKNDSGESRTWDLYITVGFIKVG